MMLSNLNLSSLPECNFEVRYVDSVLLNPCAEYQRLLRMGKVAKIAANFSEYIANEPKVSYRDGRYFVFDGQNTIEARKTCNGGRDLPIRCKVFYGLSKEHEALLFAVQTGISSELTAGEQLRAKLVAHEENACDFVSVTEDTGVRVALDGIRAPWKIYCIRSAYYIYKSYPFRYEGNGNQLFVFEAPIDLLSFICLYPQDWQKRNYLALGGVSGKALDRFLSERKDTQKVFLCLDSDTAGSEACTRLAQSIPSEIAVIRLVPARKDWNDVLRQQGDIPSRKFIAETITLRELPTAQPVPMLRMADVELTSVDWLWFPYIPFGKLTIIQGNPGEGKTYFAMRLAAACTNRKPLPGMETIEPFNIIYQTAEDGLGDTVKPRLMEADADLERVLVIDDRDTPLTLADERIARAIRENNARLVIIDPVQAFLGADVDMNRANEVRPIFRSLGDIAQATGCAIVLIGHLNKAAGTQSTYRGLGSIDITAAVRSLLFIGKLKDSPTTRVLIHEKSSLAPPGQSLAFSLGDEKGFEWIGAYDITADELLAGTDTAKTESKTAQAQMLILELLADGKRMPSAELEKAVNERGISSRTMRTAKSRIGDRLVTEKDGTAWVCYLRD